jgi:hypothetical protein
VRAAGLHDGSVTSIQLAVPTSTFLVSGVGSSLCVTLEGVASFGARGLRDGAIVDTLYVFRPGRAPTPPAHAWETLWAGDFLVTDPGAEATIHAATKAFHLLVLLECSYGGSVSWLCRAITLARESPGAGGDDAGRIPDGTR